MSEVELCEKIQDELLRQNLNLSDEILSNLYAVTISSINNVLENGDTLDISDIGSFTRKKGITSSLSFFKPIGKSNDLK